MTAKGHPPTLRLTRAQVREIDRLSIERYHIPGVVLMENAARAVTDAASNMLLGVKEASVLIVCGGGNNGGDGFAVARHLHNRGVDIEVALAHAGGYRDEAAANLRIIQEMDLPRIPIADAGRSLDAGIDLIIDALFGTGLETPPRDPRWIQWMNNAGVPILAVDIPSGLDCDTGEPLGPACVRATRTVTFVAEKAGFSNPNARQYLGEVTVGDIGCPRELIDSIARGASPRAGPT
jgi:NAD(P)H-hydrate epimerase